MLPERILTQVQGPAQYLGGEYNAVVKDPSQVRVHFALCYPDVYEVGMSHLGSQVLYHVINSRPDAACERVYYPKLDAAELMQCEGVKLGGLETGRSLCDFDVVGITLQYELTYTTILALLELGGVPIRSEQRGPQEPLVIGGGPCAYNPEPLAAFFDAFVIGDGEAAVGELLDVYVRHCPDREKATPRDRTHLLEQLAQIPGVYVPSLYDAEETEQGMLIPRPHSAETPVKVTRRIIRDLEAAPIPKAPIVPWIQIVHDRAQIEIARGCTRGCRFCQAGITYRPVRERSLATIREAAREIITNTGYDEISLVSLNCPDHSQIVEIIDALHADLGPLRVAVALPSLRTDTFSVELAQKVQQVRKSGLTLAPEAGSQRLRDAVNKGVTDQDLFNAVTAAFEAGWETIKLYFMIGLPGETDEDVTAIADVVEQVIAIGRRKIGRRRRHLQVNVSVACMIPKPHTPFQWLLMTPLEQLQRKQDLLRKRLKKREVKLSCHDAHSSLVEAILGRGDRSLGPVIEQVYRDGGALEAWSENFSFERWQNALARRGRDWRAEAYRTWDIDAPLPWGHIDVGVSVQFLRDELERAEQELTTEDCRFAGCQQCGLDGAIQPCPMNRPAAAEVSAGAH